MARSLRPGGCLRLYGRRITVLLVTPVDVEVEALAVGALGGGRGWRERIAPHGIIFIQMKS